MTIAEQKLCPDCDGPNSDADLCHAERDADGLPARCVNEWSDEKLFYLRNYATIFSKGMKNKWTNRVYLDLFAGPGRYRVKPTGRFEDGSPLIALGLPFTHLFFCDLSAHVTAALGQRVNKRVHDDQYARVLTGDANGLVQELRRQVTNLGRETLSLAFIDPPGTQIRFDSIRMLQDKLPMDLLINFPLGMNINRQHWHRRAADDDEFDAYLGTPEWRQAKDGRELLVLYKEQLQTLGYRCMDTDLTIRNRRKNQRLYVLILASKHPRGDEFWKKATHRDSAGQESLFGHI